MERNNARNSPSGKEVRLHLGETRLQRIRFNLGWYALRFFIPELFQPTGVSKTLILLNLSRTETRMSALSLGESAHKADGVEAKDLLIRQKGILFRY